MNLSTLNERLQIAEGEIHETKQMLLAHMQTTAGLPAALAENSAANARIEAAVETNRRLSAEAVQGVISSNAELLEFFGAMKAAFKVLDWIGRLAKPLRAIAFLGTSLWGVWMLIKAGFHK